jgi:hypothetical protein
MEWFQLAHYVGWITKLGLHLTQHNGQVETILEYIIAAWSYQRLKNLW